MLLSMRPLEIRLGFVNTGLAELAILDFDQLCRCRRDFVRCKASVMFRSGEFSFSAPVRAKPEVYAEVAFLGDLRIGRAVGYMSCLVFVNASS
jgi:hypothetical protein